jgi:hypothetical protein
MEVNIKNAFCQNRLAGCGIESSGQGYDCGRPFNMVDSVFVPLKAEELLGSQERVPHVELHLHKVVKESVIFQVKLCVFGSEGWLSMYSG